MAAEMGHEAIVKTLLDKGADPRTNLNNGRTPLLMAAGKKHEAVVRLLRDWMEAKVSPRLSRDGPRGQEVSTRASDTNLADSPPATRFLPAVCAARHDPSNGKKLFNVHLLVGWGAAGACAAACQTPRGTFGVPPRWLADLKKTPCCAATPLAMTTTISTARPMAHGQDTIKTVMAYVIASTVASDPDFAKGLTDSNPVRPDEGDNGKYVGRASAHDNKQAHLDDSRKDERLERLGVEWPSNSNLDNGGERE